MAGWSHKRHAVLTNPNFTVKFNNFDFLFAISSIDTMYP